MIKALLAYQQKDAELRKIEVELAKSPSRKALANAVTVIKSVPETITKLDDRAGSLALQYQELTLELKKLCERQQELSKIMESTEDQTEISYLLKKADELIAQIKQVSASANKVNEDLQRVLKEYSSARTSHKNAQAQYLQSKEEYDKLEESFKSSKDEIVKELEKLKAKVDKQLMERYEKKRANKIFPIVYEASGEVCGYCNMELSLSEQNKLRNGEIIDCDQCGKMLYKS